MAAISACSFVVEPSDLWLRLIARPYLSVAPRLERRRLGDCFVCPGESAIVLPSLDVPWIDGPLTSAIPDRRIDAAAALGIRAEVIFPTYGWTLFRVQDRALEAATMAAYNRWFTSIASSSPLRFFGAALIPSGEAGLSELERCAKLTFRVAIMAASSTAELPIALLDTAEALGMAVVLVKRSGATPPADLQRFGWESNELAVAARRQRPRARLAVLCGRTIPPVSDDAISYVVTGPRPQEDANAARMCWGHLGADRRGYSDQAATFDRENALRLYKLPDIADTRFDDMRRARQLAARPN